ncbi:MAG: hypothetical protein ABJN36_17570 [Cyclobacteriaceae bacterium]
MAGSAYSFGLSVGIVRLYGTGGGRRPAQTLAVAGLGADRVVGMEAVIEG